MIDEAETRAFYGSQETPWLVQLRHAFKLDERAARSETSLSFCRQRIALIDEILKDRDRAGVVQR